MELFEGSGVCAPMSSGLPLLLLSSAPSDRAWGCAAGAPCSGRWELGCVRARPRQGRLSRGAQAPLSPSPTRTRRCTNTALGGRQAPLGTIPARAGEPAWSSRRRSARRDYPRSCGGTRMEEWQKQADSGLSPLVRGNPIQPEHRRLPVGTIPARAGEPTPGAELPPIPGDYPRSCGGTGRSRHRRPPLEGLSPLVRGNHDAGQCAVFAARTIPARAGEPGTRPDRAPP